MTEIFSRRDFLKLTGITSASLALSACGVKTTQAPTTISVSPTGTIAPTRIPTPTATTTIGPTQQPLDELLANEIKTFVASMNLKESDVVTDTKTVTDIHGQGFQVILDTKTSTPLLAKNAGGNWQSANFKELARHGDMLVGFITEEPEAQLHQLFAPEFNKGIIPCGWAWYQPTISSTSFDFHILDLDATAAKSLGIINLRLAAVFSGRGDGGLDLLPEWLQQDLKTGISKEQLTDYMTKIVQATMAYIRDHKDFFPNPPEVIVVNEPLTETDPFVDILGEEYIDQMYQVARETYPETKLMFNMRDAHHSKGMDTAVCLKTVQRLKSKGLIDTAGFQMHLDIDTMHVPPDDVTKTIKSFDIPSAITEFTISLEDLHTSQAQRFAEQARVAETQLSAAIQAGVKDISFWGDIDPDRSEPCLWDQNINPKPFYYAVRRAILKAVV